MYGLCEKCEGLTSWNSHFQSWICSACGHRQKDAIIKKVYKNKDEIFHERLGSIE